MYLADGDLLMYIIGYFTQSETWIIMDIHIVSSRFWMVS